MLSLLRIWFDILTPKQVMFFEPAIVMLKKHGHEVLCTSREYREANELANLRHINLKKVGKHGGAEKSQKLWESANRVLELTDLINSYEPNVAVSFSSPEACRVAFGLGIGNVGFNDSPHASAVAKLSLPLIDSLLCPWIIPSSCWLKYGLQKRNIIKYRALDPVAWLRRIGKFPHMESDSRSKKKTVLIRMVETEASYIIDEKSRDTTMEMIDRIIDNLSDIAKFHILCRYKDQQTQVASRYSEKANIISNVIDGIHLLSQSDIFIGAGGTMTAEAALLGKPTISIAPVSFYVEKYLISQGLAKKATSPERLEKITRKMITDEKYAHKQLKIARKLVNKMEDPIEKLALVLTRYE